MPHDTGDIFRRLKSGQQRGRFASLPHSLVSGQVPRLEDFQEVALKHERLESEGASCGGLLRVEDEAHAALDVLAVAHVRLDEVQGLVGAQQGGLVPEGRRGERGGGGM